MDTTINDRSTKNLGITVRVYDLYRRHLPYPSTQEYGPSDRTVPVVVNVTTLLRDLGFNIHNCDYHHHYPTHPVRGSGVNSERPFTVDSTIVGPPIRV